MYFATMDPASGKLVRLRLTPTRIKHFKVIRVSADDALWLRGVLARESKEWGVRIEDNGDRSFAVRWERPAGGGENLIVA